MARTKESFQGKTTYGSALDFAENNTNQGGRLSPTQVIEMEQLFE